MTKQQKEIESVGRHMLTALREAALFMERPHTSRGERDYAIGKAMIAIARAEAVGIKTTG